MITTDAIKLPKNALKEEGAFGPFSGELMRKIGHAFGAAFDNPDLIVACIIGDGEAETGPLAAAWQSNKFPNPISDGAVLPILHLNGIDRAINKKADIVRVYLPPDANCLLSVIDHCLRSRPYVNVVDLMKLQPSSEHRHGLSDHDFDSLFTKDKHIIFAFRGYPWLVHRLTYRRTNHHIHVRGYKEECTITTPFDMRVQNDIDRFHLVQDVIDRVPDIGTKREYVKQIIHDKLIEHKHYIKKHGQDMPEILH